MVHKPTLHDLRAAGWEHACGPHIHAWEQDQQLLSSPFTHRPLPANAEPSTCRRTSLVCLAYQLSIGEDHKICIFERYTDLQYVEEVHWKSEPFLKFRSDMSGIDWQEKQVTKLDETDIGFMGR